MLTHFQSLAYILHIFHKDFEVHTTNILRRFYFSRYFEKLSSPVPHFKQEGEAIAYFDNALLSFHYLNTQNYDQLSRTDTLRTSRALPIQYCIDCLVPDLLEVRHFQISTNVLVSELESVPKFSDSP